MKYSYLLFVFSISIMLFGCTNKSNEWISPMGEYESPFIPFDYYKIDADSAYNKLISLLNREFPGRGMDTFDSIQLDRPMAYGLILSAECNRFKQTKDSTAFAIIKPCAKWLIDNSDQNKNNIHSYGLADSNDAFGDGTYNPELIEYTITTAIALIGLVDYYSILPENKEKNQIGETIAKCIQPYLDSRYDSPIGIPRYSLHSNDSIYDIFNPAALLAGQMQKFSALITVDSIRTKYSNRATDIIGKIMAHAKKDENGNTCWNYYVQKESSNDLLHIWYINEGIREYINNEGTLQIDWKKIVDHSDLFLKEKIWYRFKEPKKQTTRRNLNLWSGGAHLYALSREKRFEQIGFYIDVPIKRLSSARWTF